MVVVQWNASGLIPDILWGGDHKLSLRIERIHSTEKRRFLFVQNYVRTLNKLKYQVYQNFGIKLFHRIQGFADVAGVANVAGA